MRWRNLVLLVLLAPVLHGAPLPAPASAKAFDDRVTAELDAKSHEAAALFRQANAAREKEDHAGAARLYGEVLARVPGWVHATRRLAMEELRLGHRDRALALAKQALAADHSAENLSAMSHVLMENGTTAEKGEAVADAREAMSLAPGDPVIVMGAAWTGLQGGDLTLLDDGVAKLRTLAGDDPRTSVLAALARASHGEFGDAQDELARARKLGLPEKEYRDLSKLIDSARPLWRRLLVGGLTVLAAWVAAFLLLLGGGDLLSRATLRSAAAIPPESTGEARGADARLRRTYAWLLRATCVAYYVSLPLLAVLVVVVGGGLIWAVFALGYVPIKLVAIVAIVTLVSVFSILRSVFVRGKDGDPGTKLPLEEHPRLAALLREVAAKVGTRPVDSVYLTPGTDLAVFERGSLLKGSHRERCLLLGAGVLPGFRLGPFRAVLAHEYGHFSNRDTAGGGLALAVRRSLVTMARHLAEGGAAAWYNPAWLFVHGFFRVFLRVSQGASRLQEILADRWAAFCYGAEAFAEGLRHAIAASVRFDAHVGATLDEVVEGKRALVNLYQYRPEKTKDAEVDEAVQKALEAEPSPYDSHPSPADRIRWVERVARAGEPSADDGEEAWTLFADREALERQLTADVRATIRERHGVEIAAGG